MPWVVFVFVVLALYMLCLYLISQLSHFQVLFRRWLRGHNKSTCNKAFHSFILSQLSLLQGEIIWRTQGSLLGGGFLTPFTSRGCRSSLLQLYYEYIESSSGDLLLGWREKKKSLRIKWSSCLKKKGTMLYAIANGFTEISNINLHLKQHYLGKQIWSWY